MDELISVIIKEPGKKPKRKTIKNTLEALQKVVGGYRWSFNERRSDLSVSQF